ncbi:hypothetical protein OGW44_14385 [Citrobacter sp. Cb023]|uniref:hypothetical protein n=1 Tax=Citrobacter sp. Cb023 TaxID=2985020 RepID=UPI0025771D79|nr:hypothetical protein [Citrobacter sp. Cb023]MDM3430868.1 hypothetical protein [Citrobacter sp. Cb023]
MSVKRYWSYAGGDSSMQETETGNYVKYEDYASLERKNIELAVQLANSESKCGELSVVVAENAALKTAAKETLAHWAAAEAGEMELMMDKCMPALRDAYCETPATDTFLAEVRARELDSLAGVAETMLVKLSNQRCSSDMHEVVGWKMVLQQASNRAAQLRKGAAL